jgi:hypothetical protein
VSAPPVAGAPEVVAVVVGAAVVVVVVDVVVDGEVCALAGPAEEARRVTTIATMTDSGMARLVPAMRMSCLLGSSDAY